jgi:peptide/nickel transport system substrate-binding protein
MVCKRPALLLLCALWTLLETAIAVGGAGAEEARRGGTLNIGIPAKVLGFDPYTTKSTSYESVMAGGLIFGNLMALDAAGHQIPSQALSVESSADGLVWRVKLRPGMRFSDGSPYDAEAFAKHYARVMDNSHNKAFALNLEAYKEVVAIDPVAVEFRLKHPWPAFGPLLSYNNFVAWVMPPRHEATAGADLNRTPIGAGPYMLENWNQDGDMVLIRNPNYWDPAAQHLDKIVIKFIPDENSRYAAVKSGDLDLTPVTFEQVIDARKIATLQVIAEKGSGAATLQFNTTVAPVDDKRVRHALAYAVDREVLNKVIYAGEGEMAKSFWPPGSSWECPGIAYPEYDPAKAKVLLAEYGKPVTIRLQTTPAPIAVLTAELYQSFWQKVGVKTEIRQVQSGPAYFGPVVSGTYMAALWNLPDLPDPDRQVYATYHSGSGANFTRTNDPLIDAALERGRRTTDVAARKQSYCDFARELNEYLPALLQAHNVYYAVANRRLRGLHHLTFGRFWPAEIWLEK